MMKCIRVVVLLVIVVVFSSCKSEESCDQAKVFARSEGRRVISRERVEFRRSKGEWLAERVVRSRGWEDRGERPMQSGTLEVFDRKGGILLARTSAHGPAYLEERVFAGIGGRLSAEARDIFLDGATFFIDLPPVKNGLVGYLRWIPSSALVELRQAAKDRLSGEIFADLSALPVDDVSEATEQPLKRDDTGLSSPFALEAVRWSGHPRNRMNLVIFPDGYTEEQLGLYQEHADGLVNELLSNHSPYRDYRDLINIVRVDVPSKEEGADCEDLTFSRKKNRYGSTFPVACLNAIFGTKHGDRFMYQANLARMSRDKLRVYYDGVSIADEMYVVVNSPKPSGTAIFWATQTIASPQYVMAHELGHSWGGLADEYLEDGDMCNIFMASAPNLSLKKKKISAVKWKHWIVADTPIPTPDTPEFDGVVGLFQGGAGGCKTAVYHPARECKMLGSEHQSFCPVCLEQMILRTYDRINPIGGPLTNVGSEVSANVAIGERLRSRWYVDGKLVQDTPAYAPFRNFKGKGRVELFVVEESAPVRRDRCNLVYGRSAAF